MDEEITKVELPYYDKCIQITNCIVEVLENTETGEISYGYYRTDDSEEIEI